MPAADLIEHILLIDDEEDCNFVTRMVLKRSGFAGRITCFTNATAALATCSSRFSAGVLNTLTGCTSWGRPPMR